MKMSVCTHDVVLHVAQNMRERDQEEIYNLRWDDNPFTIVNDVMARPEMSWAVWLGDEPVAVFGGMRRHPGVWSMFCFATDDFHKIALPLTRFCKNTLVPTLLNTVGAHRLECDSHEKHRQAHRWLRLFGARQESTKRRYGRDGSDYFTFVILSENSTKSTDAAIV